MATLTIWLKDPVFLHLPSVHNVFSPFENCTLAWEKEALVVTPHVQASATEVPALRNEAWLRDCLNRSPVQKVYLDLSMDESGLKAWADICEETNKHVYLSVPSTVDLPQRQQPKLWKIKRLIDWLAAALLLGLLSPLMALVMLCISLESPGPILSRQWRVGHHGRLFQVLKFRSSQIDTPAKQHEVIGKQRQRNGLAPYPRLTKVGSWLKKLSLDELPQLLNVLRGEISLVGPKPCALYEAVRIESMTSHHRRLDALPGITGIWHLEDSCRALEIDKADCQDSESVKRWSLLNDFYILLSTIPKMLFGVSAC